jgi:hypothetical protein
MSGNRTCGGGPAMTVTGYKAEVGLWGRQGSFCRVDPGNFTPSLSQIPDLNLSIHPARAID